jgi:hypothetical protein
MEIETLQGTAKKAFPSRPRKGRRDQHFVDTLIGRQCFDKSFNLTHGHQQNGVIGDELRKDLGKGLGLA